MTQREFSSDVAFSPSVKAIQTRKGSRAAFRRLEERGGFATRITPDLAQFIAEQRSVFLATASADGQPYIQHRGGPPGFIQALDEETVGVPDFSGNRQYITIGNLAENARAYLFLIDYAARRRVKIWGTARVVEDDASVIAQLAPTEGGGRVERAILFHVDAWDVNCPAHIPQRFEAEDVAAAIAARDARIAELEAQLSRALERRA
jgi:uncharacterized protein